MSSATTAAPGARVGVWIIGARGSVATTVVAGAAALGAGAGADGCVTRLLPFRDAGLPDFADLVFGGHDIARTPLTDRAAALVAGGVLPPSLPEAVREELRAADREIRDAAPRPGEPQAVTSARHAQDIAGFRDRHGLEQVVVVNLASTEPPAEPDPAHLGLVALEEAMRTRDDVLPASALYAHAAITAECAYLNFTPSTGASLPALEEFARHRGLPHAGRDGKTGETLIKSALAPVFAQRALRVRSWSGTNLLGGGDGATLSDPAAARSKTAAKQRGLEQTLGHSVDGRTHIDHVPDMGEWKTAWDHVSFEGFLGVRMSLQFTWQGCDSALAAPLVLDLVRLLALARRRGERGTVAPLGFFFKDPAGSTEHNPTRQFAQLVDWVAAGAPARRLTGAV